MIVKSYLCGCGTAQLKEVPLEHWTRRECPRPPMPVPFLLATVRAQGADRSHRDNRITATRLLGCTRETAILDNLPVRLNPLALNSATWGTAIHDFMKKWAELGEYREVSFPLEGQGPPIIAGIPVCGTVDFFEIRQGEGSIFVADMEDYKTHSESAMLYRIKDANQGVQSGDYRAQFTVYKRCIEHCVADVKVENIRVWDGAMVSSNRQLWRELIPRPWVDTRIDAFSDAELAAFKPKGGEATVAEIAAEFYAFVQKGDFSARGIKAGTGLRGRSMMGGKKCPMYCLAREVCDEMEGILRP